MTWPSRRPGLIRSARHGGWLGLVWLELVWRVIRLGPKRLGTRSINGRSRTVYRPNTSNMWNFKICRKLPLLFLEWNMVNEISMDHNAYRLRLLKINQALLWRYPERIIFIHTSNYTGYSLMYSRNRLMVRGVWSQSSNYHVIKNIAYDINSGTS